MFSNRKFQATKYNAVINLAVKDLHECLSSIQADARMLDIERIRKTIKSSPHINQQRKDELLYTTNLLEWIMISAHVSTISDQEDTPKFMDVINDPERRLNADMFYNLKGIA